MQLLDNTVPEFHQLDIWHAQACSDLVIIIL